MSIPIRWQHALTLALTVLIVVLTIRLAAAAHDSTCNRALPVAGATWQVDTICTPTP